MLVALMAVLSVGFISIVAAAVREGTLESGEAPNRRARIRGRIAGGVASALVVVVLILGNWWWSAEASGYARYVYKPLEASTAMSGESLTLSLRDPGWIRTRRLDDFVTDHGHVMHLFVVSPTLDRLWHLHPKQTGLGRFEHPMPAFPQGRYEFFADLVHESGIAETVTGRLDVPARDGTPLEGDDSRWSADSRSSRSDASIALLEDGSRMVWVGDHTLRPRQLGLFTFRIEDTSGTPVTDLELYMGMPGHAIFISKDRQVFAHVHPSGSAPMAAMEIGRRSLTASNDARPDTADHAQHLTALPPTVSFPFGFPRAGDYRIFVQVKRGGRVQTGAFDAHVE
jgi:hypothetical protein